MDLLPVDMYIERLDEQSFQDNAEDAVFELNSIESLEIPALVDSIIPNELNLIEITSIEMNPIAIESNDEMNQDLFEMLDISDLFLSQVVPLASIEEHFSKKCSVEGCDNGAQKGGICIRHGGGDRCAHEGCTKSSQGNFMCRAHGGGKRCDVFNCTKSAQRNGLCAQHGGKKYCTVEGCNRTDRGAQLCMVHRKERLCRSPGCHKIHKGSGYCPKHLRQQDIVIQI